MQAVAIESPPQIVETLISYRPLGRPANTFAIILPPNDFPTPGTDGQYLSPAFAPTAQRIPLSMIPGAFAIALSRDPTEIVAALLHIRRAFALNMTELAQALGVSRPTAYAWLNGAEPRASVALEIWKFAALADHIKDLGLENPRLLRKPIQGSDSVVSVLLHRQNLADARRLLEELERSQTVAAPRIRSGRLKSVYTAEDVSSVVSAS